MWRRCGSGVLAKALLGVTFSLILVSGVVAVSRRRWAGIVTGVIAAFAFVLEWAGQWSGSSALESARAIASLMFTATLAGVVLAQVLREGRITIHRIVGSATAYLLLGLTWGEIYHLLAVSAPKAFTSSVFPSVGQSELYYFSIVTLTTLGYGDITPVHPLARSLVSLGGLYRTALPCDPDREARLDGASWIENQGTQSPRVRRPP